jgi:hypothetical protein
MGGQFSWRTIRCIERQETVGRETVDSSLAADQNVATVAPGPHDEEPGAYQLLTRPDELVQIKPVHGIHMPVGQDEVERTRDLSGPPRGWAHIVDVLETEITDDPGNQVGNFRMAVDDEAGCAGSQTAAE